MSELSGVFDQLADALKQAGASPSTTLRQHRPVKPRVSLPPPPKPAPAAILSAADVIDTPTLGAAVIPPKPPRKVDRSRDRAVYAAPHRPVRAHACSRPDDVITERILRRALESATRATRKLSVPSMVLTTFLVTVSIGVLTVLALNWR